MNDAPLAQLSTFFNKSVNYFRAKIKHAEISLNCLIKYCYQTNMKSLQTLLIVLLLFITSNIQAQLTDCQSERYKEQVFDNIRRTNDITFGVAQNVLGFDQSLELDFYEPDPGDEYLEKRPLVVMFFGGAFTLGSKQDADITAWCDSLAHYGYACAAVEYRLDNAPNLLLPGRPVRAAYRAIQDGRAAIRYLLADPNGFGFNIDPDHIYTGGESAGAITAIHVAYLEESERPADTYSGFLLSDQGCLDCSGNNFVQPFSIAGIIDLWGATLSLDYIDAAENVPMVIIHGEDDFIVPYTSGPPFNIPTFPTMYGAVPMDAELTAKGICHQFYSYPGEGHVFYGIPSGIVTFPNELWAPVFTQGQEFLYVKTLQFDSPVPTGETMVCQGATETYDVAATAGSIYCWDVVNGTIVSTNNNQVTVQWNTSPGYLTLIETNCIDVVGTSQTIEVLPFACCAPMDLAFNFDASPQQTTWEILDVDGNVVATGGAYNPGDVSTTEGVCLPDGCYDLVVYDSANDGMCPRRTSTVLTGINIATLGLGGVFNGIPRMMCGNYTLTDALGNTLASGGGRFGASETNTFCVTGGMTPLQQDDDTYQRTTNDISTNINIYPNPAHDQITIEHNIQTENNIQISIMDVNGRMIKEHLIINVNDAIISLNVSDLASGVYFAQMLFDDIVVTEKFVVR